MPQTAVFSLLGCAVFVLGACSRRAEDPSPPPRSEAASAVRPASPKASVESEAALEPTALVELFTSEGCSSCPPADRNLSRIARDAQSSGRRVVALSFHVDYWNQLGWADPFSSSQSSERQRKHARALGGGVYTPEMVVNGRTQLLGSDADAADRAITAALGRAASASLHFEPSWTSRGVAIPFRAEAPPLAASVCFAVAQGAHAVHVTRGENRGETLSHDNVVRAFECTRYAPRGDVFLDVPKEVSRERALVVGWVEDERAGVLGVQLAASS